MSLEEAAAASRKAANRLHHLSMCYSGALIELLQGEKVGVLPSSHPGLREARDFIDLILFTRAEINALSRLLIGAGVLTTEQEQLQFAVSMSGLPSRRRSCSASNCTTTASR